MKQVCITAAALCIWAGSAEGQWYTKTYNFAPGWNGIWLSGDASYTTVAALFGGTLSSGTAVVSEVWRWNPNPDQTQFIQNPGTPTSSSEEWTVWKRDRTETKLVRMVGNSAYLIRTTGPLTFSLTVRALPPSANWLLSGANFLGFPSLKKDGPVISKYLSSMLSGGSLGLPAGVKVYKYVGGDLGTGNPVSVPVGSERLDPDTAYWFNYSAVSNFTGPVQYELPTAEGMVFGRTQPTQLLGITNRTTSQLNLTFVLEPRVPAPAGQSPVLGDAPLVLKSFSSDTNTFSDVPIGPQGFPVQLEPSARKTLAFAVNRTGMSEGGVYASVLRVTDSQSLSEVRLPVTAQAASKAGLWVVEVRVNAVETSPSVRVTATSSRPGTAQAFPLYYLLHVDGSGKARVLRQAFIGKLLSEGNATGITVSESFIQSAAVSDVKPRRYFSPTMPYATPVVEADGAASSALQWTLKHGHDDQASPFVHTYHPDHDNLDATLSTKLPAGVESYKVERSCSLTFTESPPDGTAPGGDWGSMIFGGTYAETITGASKYPLKTRGIFWMRRLSEISDIHTTTP